MSVIYKVITRPTDPRVPNSPKRFYPHLITLGQSVSLKYLAEKMRDRSSLSVGDIKSVIQNFVDKMKEQLLEGKSVNIEGLGVLQIWQRILQPRVWRVSVFSFRQIKSCASQNLRPVKMKSWT